MRFSLNGTLVNIDSSFGISNEGVLHVGNVPDNFVGTIYPRGWLRLNPEQRAALGFVEVPDDPPPPPAPPQVPQTVSPRQARHALRAAGLLSAVNAAVAAATEEVQIDWEYANEIRRDNPVIAAMAATLNLTEAQIDDLFFAAAAIV